MIITTEQIEKVQNAMKIAKLLPEKPTIDLVGSWVWLSFSGKPSEGTRQIMKDNRFYWQKVKKMWYFSGHKKFKVKRTEDWINIVAKYGQKRVFEHEEEKEKQAA